VTVGTLAEAGKTGGAGRGPASLSGTPQSTRNVATKIATTGLGTLPDRLREDSLEDFRIASTQM
jgi:hypothetical protein